MNQIANQIAHSILSVIIFILFVLVLSSVVGCAASTQAVEVASSPVEPPGTMTVDFADNGKPRATNDVPATSSRRHTRYACQWVLVQTGDAFDTKAQAVSHAKALGIPSVDVGETCRTGWRLASK